MAMHATNTPSPASPNGMKDFLVKWTPRLLVATLTGYYSLGIAYEYGIMASIDKVAIRVLKNWVGYAGLGAAMPTFQWYAAWAVRMSAAASAGIGYDLGEKFVRYFISKIRKPNPLQINHGVCFSSCLRI